ncbi:GH116 family glycosyl hydrolase [Olivibacter sp. CPCC 100613]|uniref:GH116 family glycosyl hydrolase n=1 Tax=Olivibacter sp. CPCC 100613 TaxID=3079931 RepID=UPI002FFA2129
MQQKKDRRSFIRNLALGGAAVGAAPAVLFASGNAKEPKEQPVQTNSEAEPAVREFNGPYTGDHLHQIAFPIGGIGAGMFCLEGSGAISHVSIRHKPELFHEPTVFGAIAIKGNASSAKVLEGPVPDWKLFGYKDYGGGSGGTTYGLPHFEKAEFAARFPFAEVQLRDDKFPLQVQLEAWSPFIPSDADNSSLPVGALTYRFINTSQESIDAVFSFNSRNFVVQPEGKGSIKKMQHGFVLSQTKMEGKNNLASDFAIFADTENEVVVDYCWFRGGWFDPLTMVWNTIKDAKVKAVDPIDQDAPGASLFIPFQVAAKEEKVIRILMAWYVPESNEKAGQAMPDDKAGKEACCTTPAALGMADAGPLPANYKPWYSEKFKNIGELVDYWKKNYPTLYKNTSLFRETFYASTLPPEVLEAVAANLSILKTPTVRRQHDGRLWAYEGIFPHNGCCDGSCTHVWNYAQALPHLFPSLERSLRLTEFCENQNAEGHQGFRANLPISPLKHDFHAAADGQLGGIMKVYRDWRIAGDDEWMKKLYPMVQKSLDYCIQTWDPKEKGILEEPHHNTYDIEFWGPNGMCTSFYLGALKAFIEMGRYQKKRMKRYEALYDRGKTYMEDQLYNGEYFIQKIQWTGLKAPDPTKAQSFHTQYTPEAIELLKKEGPKYQYGTGCLSDGVIGAWMATMCGLENPLDQDKVNSHLRAVHRYNLKDDLTDHINPQRPTYAMGHEGGLLLCTWPKGGMLSLPFVYSNEVWTGIEYQVASHLMQIGEVNSGLEIIRACRKRYDGRIRNPFNEYECGSWYARAMASYACLQAMTGVRYDAVDQVLHIDSKIGDFSSFLATDGGFGLVSLKNGKPALDVVYGAIPTKEILLSGKKLKFG